MSSSKLSPEQFRDLAKKLPEIRLQKKELSELVKSKSARINEILGTYYSWAEIYERPFVEQIAYLFVLIGMDKPIHEIAQSTAPKQTFIESSKHGGKLDQWFESNKDNIDDKYLLWICIVLQRNVLASCYFISL